jgi:hypothetical protein
MDNCSPHVVDAVIAVLTGERVKIIAFASDTTHIFQILDVKPFYALQKHATGLSTFDEE